VAFGIIRLRRCKRRVFDYAVSERANVSDEALMALKLLGVQL
jgi:hypothetical protein